MFSKCHLLYKKHGEEKNPKDELLLRDPKKISSQKSMNSQRSDYNMCTNLPFVEQLALLKYIVVVKD